MTKSFSTGVAQIRKVASPGPAALEDVRAAAAPVWQALRDHAVWRQYPAKSVLIGQGEPSSRVFLLEEGLIKLCHTRETGARVILTLRMPPWPFGTAAALLGQPQPTTVETVTRTAVREVDTDYFCARLRDDQDLALAVARLHSLKIQQYVEHLADLGCLSAKQRVKVALGQLLELLGPATTSSDVPLSDSVRMALPLTQLELAQLVMVAPETLSRLLGELEQEGIIRRSNGWLMIQSPRELLSHSARDLS